MVLAKSNQETKRTKLDVQIKPISPQEKKKSIQNMKSTFVQLAIPPKNCCERYFLAATGNATYFKFGWAGGDGQALPKPKTSLPLSFGWIVKVDLLCLRQCTMKVMAGYYGNAPWRIVHAGITGRVDGEKIKLWLFLALRSHSEN